MRLKRVIFLRTALLLCILITCICLFSLIFMRLSYRNESRSLWLSRSTIMAGEVKRLYLWDDRVALRKLLDNEVRGNDTLAYAFVVSDAEDYVSTFAKGVPAALLRRALQTDASRSWEFRDHTGQTIYNVMAPVDADGTTLHLGLREESIDRQMRPLQFSIVAVSVAVGGIGLLLCIVLARQTTREVDSLVEALRIYGEVSERDAEGIHATTREVGELVSSFKELTLQRKRAEQDLRNLNAELEQRVQERTAQLAAANQELDAFAYSVSHDLRAPLRGIDGFSLALLEDFGSRLDPEAQGYLQRIRNGCARMSRLIDDMLHLSRVTRTQVARQSVDLSALAGEVVDELRQSEPQRRVEVVVPSALPVNADPKLLRTVLDNLLGNAWKFTAQTPAARIVVGVRRQEDETVYSVQDNGAGFDMRYVDKLFGAFQRLHGADEFAGSGIGLATVKRVINRHGGRVWAEGRVGAGATFYFTLGESADEGKDDSAG